MGILRDRRPVVEAEDGEVELEEPADASLRRLRVVVVVERDVVQASPFVVRQQIGAEEDARLALEQERVVSSLRARRVDGAQTPRQLVARLIAAVRLLLVRRPPCGRVHRHGELPTEPPCGALVALGGQADRLHGAELRQRVRLERKRVDQDDAAVRLDRVGVGLVAADSVVPRDRPPPHARNDFLDAIRERVRLGHAGYRREVPAVAHWDDVEGRRREAGHIDGRWDDLGSAAGSSDVGLQRIRIAPGKWSTPAHVEGGEEEIFYVLGGSGVSWQGSTSAGEPDAYEVAEGDCLVHRVGEEAHTLRAGPAGLDVLAFGQRVWHGNTILPRARVAWMWPGFVEAIPVGGEDHPFRREAAAGEPEVGELGQRPSTIVNVAHVQVEETGRDTVARARRDLGRAAGSERTGLQHVTVPPGMLGVPPHCHSAEEELFVVLDGDGTLLLGEEDHPVRPGGVIARPAATGVAHALRAGKAGLTYLAYGTRQPNDICFYPRSGKISFRGVGVIGRIEQLDYWDGES